MSTYLITGGAGFIGSSLIEELLKNKNNNLITIDNFCDLYDPKIKEKNINDFLNVQNFKLYRNDIRDKGALSKIFS